MQYLITRKAWSSYTLLWPLVTALPRSKPPSCSCKSLHQKNKEEFHMWVWRDLQGTITKKKTGSWRMVHSLPLFIVKWVQRAIVKGWRHSILTQMCGVSHLNIKIWGGGVFLTTKPSLQSNLKSSYKGSQGWWMKPLTIWWSVWFLDPLGGT